MKKGLFFIILIFFVCKGNAQIYSPEQVPKKARKLYDQAVAMIDAGKPYESLDQIDQALRLYPGFVEALLTKAAIYGERKNYAKAVEVYEVAIDIDPVYTQEYQLPFAINLAGCGRFEESLQAIERFLQLPNLNDRSRKAAGYRKTSMQYAIAYQKAHAYETALPITNLGDAVNTSQLEYFPSLTIDGKNLVFTRRVNWSNEDFFISARDSNEWKPSSPLAGAINTPQNEGAQQISQDGAWLVYAGCEMKDSYGSCDIYFSFLDRGGWTARENAGRAINTEFWETSPCLSPDKNDLYFASNRPGGYGGTDLYVSHRMANGRWTAAENLGASINTSGDESFPFMHADNETLYFTSNGWPGYGGTDIFFSKKGVDGFAKPMNVGYPVNTIDNEGSLVVSSDGATAYYASDRPDGKGGLDLYSFPMRKEIRPVTTSWVQGVIYDSLSKQGLRAHVDVIDLSSNRVVSQVSADETGHYLATLPMGRKYAFNVNQKGYLFYSSHFDMPALAKQEHYEVDIPLQPIVAGANIVLKNVFFNTGKWELLKESMTELDRLVVLLNENPSIQIEISGHTDNIGKDADNKTLSESRAKSVVTYLRMKGILESRLSFKGYGAARPVASNDTEEGRALNRRTEMMVVSK